ncbi:GHMP kinase [Streptomyces sp. TLI_146]|uniref:GHMP family kinase ATP-binding protein n=1 Tax=Streptomyces sp. TLI_146 TaxID=1938858 RepID=UPI000C70DA70|nr:GHMP kinase [Streptomyces sp. TLI_146]PKV89853.1 threonine kinase [Streptomyces sp. TLI_146]
MSPTPHATGAAPGAGQAHCHHGEILQGLFLDAQGRPREGLVTLPMYGLGTRARFLPRPGTPREALSVSPPGRTKALRAAALVLAECCTGAVCGGELHLDGDIPVGLGMGSSTSDVLASIRAVADAHGLHLTQQTVAALAVRAERACDPLMLDGRPVLFAQRDGHVLETLGPALPPAIVVGCTLGGGRPIDTLALPRRTYQEGDVGAYARLRNLLRLAITHQDTALLGYVSTHSARLGQQHLPHPEFPTLLRIAWHSGAVGVQIAHSGNVAGLLFDPAARALPHRLHGCRSALAQAGIPATRTFHLPPTPQEPAWTPTSPKRSAAPTSYASTTASSASASKP